MIPALLKGKLTRSEETMEDLLTSNVFGAFKYAGSPHVALIPFLAQAVNRDGDRLADHLRGVVSAEYEFWPWLAEPGAIPAEPDVLITLTHEDRHRSAVLVEAKYLSGKSSEEDLSPAPSDQLAREYDNLVRRCDRLGIRERFLVYCTAHSAMPMREMESSEREYAAKTTRPLRISWVPWRIIPQLLRDTSEPILRDLGEVLRRKGFDTYTGLSDVSSVLSAARNGADWTYRARPSNYVWSTASLPISIFKYGSTGTAYNWAAEDEPPLAKGRWKWQTDRTS